MYAFWLLPLILLPLCAHAEEWDLDRTSFFHFVTRPDLISPKWHITVHDQSRLSPGYWFLAAKLGARSTIGKGWAWTGPMIYDGEGELVWSGSAQFDSSEIYDFRLSEVGKEHETMLTMFDRDRRAGVALDNHYQIRHFAQVAQVNNEAVNAHEFRFIDNGNALVFRNHRLEITQREREAIGYNGNACYADYIQLVELDVGTGEETLRFNPYGQIGVDETQQGHDRRLNGACNGQWDFLHSNSADKCEDGHYVYSARYTDTIYKVSKDDGSIMWRLGGYKSDFPINSKDKVFSKQHDVRCRSANETHTVISLLDNAKAGRKQKGTYAFSRGLIFEMDTVGMTASLKAHYDHPEKDFAPRRGSMQVLPNGNAFMGWSENATQSEHAPDGTLLMQARFVSDWLGSYRNYKFEFTGRPLTQPDVHATAYLGEQNKTAVYVSWNGDTEVRNWNLYAVDSNSSNMVTSTPRTGFETYLEWSGFANFVRLEGVDQNGLPIGNTNAIKTIEHPSEPEKSEEEQHGPDQAPPGVQSGYDAGDYGTPDHDTGQDEQDKSSGLSISAPIFILLVVGCAIGTLRSRRVVFSWLKSRRQAPYGHKELANGNDIHLRQPLTLDDSSQSDVED